MVWDVSANPSLVKWSSVAGLCSVMFAHLAARLSNAGGGIPSPFEAPVEDIAGHLQDYAAFTAVSAYLYGLAAATLVVFAAGVWDRVTEGHSAQARTWAIVGLVGTAVYAVMLLVVGLLQLGLVGAVQRSGAALEMVAGLGILWASAVVMLVPASVPMLFGFGMAARQSKAFSGLLAGFALAGAALGLVPPPEAVGPMSPPLASVAFVLGEFQPWTIVLWVLGTAFVLRRSQATVTKDADPAD